MNQNVVPFRTRRRGCLFNPEVMAEIMVGANAPLHPKLAKALLAKAPRTRETYKRALRFLDEWRAGVDRWTTNS